MNAPVVVFGYNRPEHLKLTVEALSKCNRAKETDVYFFCDAAKNEKSQKAVNTVRNYVDEISSSTFFKTVTVYKAEKNKGLAKSIIEGVSEIIEKFGTVIVLEDDCVVSEYFLDYMNSALEYYEKDEKVGSISGYSPMLPFPDSYAKDIYFTYRSCSWTWATWNDRWADVDWKLENVAEFFKHGELMKKLNMNGNDRFLRLYKQTKGNGSSWSVRFGAHLVKNNMLTVYPKYSFTKNIGCDESGVHSSAEDAQKVDVLLDNSKKEIDFCAPFVDKRIQKLFYQFYSAGFVSNIKRFIGREIVILKYKFRG